jgi:NADP-dependent 3-hydroxy acid dehydrogenase YdfG
MDQQNALITGASSGFGKLIAVSLVEKGYKVWASMRNLEGANRLYGQYDSFLSRCFIQSLGIR